MYREFVKFLSLCLYILLLDSKFISLMYIMLKLDILFQVHIEAKKVVCSFFFAFSTKNLLFCHNWFLNIFKYIAYVNMKSVSPDFKIWDTQSQYKATFFHIIVTLIYIFSSYSTSIYTLIVFGKIDSSKNLYNFLTKKCWHHLIVWCKLLLKLGLL